MLTKPGITVCVITEWTSEEGKHQSWECIFCFFVFYKIYRIVLKKNGNLPCPVMWQFTQMYTPIMFVPYLHHSVSNMATNCDFTSIREASVDGSQCLDNLPQRWLLCTLASLMLGKEKLSLYITPLPPSILLLLYISQLGLCIQTHWPAV